VLIIDAAIHYALQANEDDLRARPRFRANSSARRGPSCGDRKDRDGEMA